MPMSPEQEQLHGSLYDVWRGFYPDSTTSRQIEMDACLAEMLQQVEDRRADALQRMVAEVLYAMEQKKAENTKNH